MTFIGADTDDAALEEDVLRRLYSEAGVKVENLPEGVIKEWRDGFSIVLNYRSDAVSIDIPADAEIILGGRELEPAGVVIWK